LEWWTARKLRYSRDLRWVLSFIGKGPGCGGKLPKEVVSYRGGEETTGRVRRKVEEITEVAGKN